MFHTATMTDRAELGKIGEQSVQDWLVKHGYLIRETNYRKPYGELDIIAEKDGIIRFIEVKTSRYHADTAFLPEVRVDRRKVANLKKLCETYLREQNVSDSKNWQIDVISLQLDDTRGTIRSIAHFENAVFEQKY